MRQSLARRYSQPSSLQPPPPSIQPQLPRPPPRGVAVAPIDVAHIAPPTVESDSAFSFSSCSTDVEDGSAMNMYYQESPQPDVESSRPEPFYLHPLPESGEEGSVGRGGGRSSEVDNMERRLGSALTSAADERWHGSYGPAPDVFIVADPLAAPLRDDLSASHSAPHLSRTPSRADSEEATPSPSDPQLLQPHLSRTRGSGFHSAGYSPIPEPRGHARSDTPRTPPARVPITERPSGRLAAGGGSRPASRAASEPRLDSSLSGETPAPCEVILVSNEAGEFRCVSVMSRASSIREAGSPVSREFSRPVMCRPAPRDTLRAPVSRGESPAGMADGFTTPAPAVSDAGGPTSSAAEDEDWSPNWSAHSSSSSLTLTTGESSSPHAMVEGETSPPVITAAERVSAPVSCEEELPFRSEETVPVTTDHRPDTATGRDWNKLTASRQHSPVTPELCRPRLSHHVYRHLELPHGGPSARSAVSAISDAGAAPGTATQSVSGVGRRQSGPTLPSEAAPVAQMPDWEPHPARSPQAVSSEESVSPDRRSLSPPAVVFLNTAPVNHRSAALRAESSSPGKKPVSAGSHVSRDTQAPPSPPAVASERQPTPFLAIPVEERREQSTLASLEERIKPRPAPSPRHRRSVSDGSPLSWTGTAGSTGWLWDEIPARPSDRAAMAQRAPPLTQVAPPAPPTPAAAAVAPSKRQVIWPPTRSNIPEQVAEPPLEPDDDPASKGPADPAATSEQLSSEVSAAPPSPTSPLPERRAEPVAAAARTPESVPADIGEKLDEIASLLRTLLLQNDRAGATTRRVD